MTKENIHNPFLIGMAVSRVSPKDHDLVKSLALNNRVTWRNRPFIHEWALTQMHFGFQEKNGFIDRKYANDMLFIFEWILTLKGEDLKSQRPGRTVTPLHLEDKTILSRQIEELKQALRLNDFKDKSFHGSLDTFLRDSVMFLREHHIFYGDGIIGAGEPV